MVNILTAAKSKLGEYPDVFFGGFHLFQLPEGEAASDKLIDETGRRCCRAKRCTTPATAPEPTPMIA